MRRRPGIGGLQSAAVAR
ncbi:hypothetical protein CISIN_1g0255992mg, partial [Citrus sinensis]